MKIQSNLNIVNTEIMQTTASSDVFDLIFLHRTRTERSHYELEVVIGKANTKQRHAINLCKYIHIRESSNAQRVGIARVLIKPLDKHVYQTHLYKYIRVITINS